MERERGNWRCKKVLQKSVADVKEADNPPKPGNMDERDVL